MGVGGGGSYLLVEVESNEFHIGGGGRGIRFLFIDQGVMKHIGLRGEVGEVAFVCLSDSRLSNHPNFVVIIPILLENPESRVICNRERKIAILTELCYDIFVKLS